MDVNLCISFKLCQEENILEYFKSLCCVVFFFLPPSQDSETNRGEYEKKRNTRDLSREISEDSDVFGT